MPASAQNTVNRTNVQWETDGWGWGWTLRNVAHVEFVFFSPSTQPAQHRTAVNFTELWWFCRCLCILLISRCTLLFSYSAYIMFMYCHLLCCFLLFPLCTQNAATQTIYKWRGASSMLFLSSTNYCHILILRDLLAWDHPDCTLFTVYWQLLHS